MSDWKTLGSRIAYDNPWIRVHEDQAINPVGEQTMYGYVESKNDSVYVVPVDEDFNTYIIQLFRYPARRKCWECVAGRINNGESAEAAARRELLEETGLRTKTVTELGVIRPASGISTFRSIVYIAQDIEKITDKIDVADGIFKVQKLSLAKARSKILAGEIQCSESIAALLMTIAHLEQQAIIIK